MSATLDEVQRPSTTAVGGVDYQAFFSKPDRACTKVFYINQRRELPSVSLQELITKSVADFNSHIDSVCLIENISPSFVEALTTSWQVDPAFFASHVSSTAPEHFFRPRRWPLRSQPSTLDMEPRSFEHLDGIFTYEGVDKTAVEAAIQTHGAAPNYCKRRFLVQDRFPPQSHTRVSYYRVNARLYLFLVDAPLYAYTRSPTTSATLRLPNNMNHRGVLLPQLLPTARYIIFDSLTSVFRYTWHFELFFGVPHGVLAGPALMYIVSNSLYLSNLRHLDLDIKRISFHEIRRPSMGITDVLHDRRESLASLQANVTEAIEHTPKGVNTYFQQCDYYSRNKERGLLANRPPDENHANVLEDAKKLESFLMETFQLLMSTISIQDSQLSIAQSKISLEHSQRGMQLTRLAFLYAPLSFLVGIFGMNLKELNGSGPSIWVCFVTLAIMVPLTWGIFEGLNWASRVKKRKPVKGD